MDNYFYIDARGQQQGPVSPELFKSLGVGSTTQVWKEGMAGWTPANQVPELAPFVQGPPPVNGAGVRPPMNNAYQEIDPGKPDNNLVWAILATVFCCLPAGIYAIIQASKVNGLYQNGHYEEAVAMARDAAKWSIISAVIGLVVNGLMIVMMLAGS